MYNKGKNYHHVMNRDEEGHIKKDNLNNKSSQCHTRIYNTYPLYKYNIVMDYHHIKNRDEERHANIQK